MKKSLMILGSIGLLGVAISTTVFADGQSVDENQSTHISDRMNNEEHSNKKNADFEWNNRMHRNENRNNCCY